MTNEEAIKRLKEVQAEFNENLVDYGGINQAFEKAYKVLEERPQGEWGKWIITEVQCPNCFKYSEVDCYSVGELNKCPSCGAQMKGGAE